MKIAALKAFKADEKRAPISLETVKKYIAAGHDVTLEKGIWDGCQFDESAAKDLGAKISTSADTAVKGADLILTIDAPTPDASFLGNIKKEALLTGILSPFDNADLFKAINKVGFSALALEFIPRISRAQAMDVLSSQSNLAGYRAVIEAHQAFNRVFPMMMTAAGTVAPAKVLVIGAGVAGLQAIATARRLGAVVSAFDVRAAAKEQVESLGAKFVEVEPDENMETDGGYAKEASDDYKARQQEKLRETLAKTDIVITTALIPGKPAPVLLDKDMTELLKAGSVIVDMAAERGGNCALTKAGKIIDHKGVQIIGFTDLPSRVAVDATNLYAKNLLNLVGLITNEEKSLTLDLEDEIIKGALITHEGSTIHPNLQEAL